MTQQVSAPDGAGQNRMFILVLGAILVAGLAVVAIVAGNRESDPVAVAQTAPVEVSGTALPPFPQGVQVSDASTDPAYGTAAPTLTGIGFDGDEVVIDNDGRAKVVYFLTHWCGHCQAEVPVIQGLLNDGKLPNDVDVYAVSTAVDQTRGNFPPSTWFEDEGFTPTVLLDDDASTALATFGGTSFPFAVYLDTNNQVIARTAGSLDGGTIEQLWQVTAAAQ